MKKIKVIFLTFVFFIISGCSYNNLNKNKIEQTVYPQWFLNPPQDNEVYAYSTGEGITKDKAIKDALNNFISKYNIIISSNLNIKKQYWYGGLVNEKNEYIINTKIEPTKLCCYKVIKVKQYSYDNFLVLVKFNKKKLIDNYIESLNTDFANFSNIFKNIKNMPVIEQYFILLELNEQLKKELKIINFLKAIKPNFDIKSYKKLIIKIQKKYHNIKNNLVINIKNINCPKEIENDIEKYLTKNKIKIFKNNNLILVLKCTEKIENNKYLQLKIYNINMNIYYKQQLFDKNIFNIILPINASLNGILYNKLKNKNLQEFF